MPNRLSLISKCPAPKGWRWVHEPGKPFIVRGNSHAAVVELRYRRRAFSLEMDRSGYNRLAGAIQWGIATHGSSEIMCFAPRYLI
jgi:hypothetical protein